MSSETIQDGSEMNLLLELELDPAVDPNQAERSSRQLLRDIRQLDVEAVDQPTLRTLPRGAKASPFDWSALLITFGAAGGVFTTLIAVARDWLIRQNSAHRIKLTIDNDSIVLDRTTSREREELINAWIRRHSGE